MCFSHLISLASGPVLTVLRNSKPFQAFNCQDLYWPQVTWHSFKIRCCMQTIVVLYWRNFSCTTFPGYWYHTGTGCAYLSMSRSGSCAYKSAVQDGDNTILPQEFLRGQDP
eukprot:3072845-Rhodomonas_salina.1